MSRIERTRRGVLAGVTASVLLASTPAGVHAAEPASLVDRGPAHEPAAMDLDEYRRTMLRGRRGLGFTIGGAVLGIAAGVLLPISHGHTCAYPDELASGAECRELNRPGFSLSAGVLVAAAAPFVGIGARDLTFALWRYRLPVARDRSRATELHARRIAAGLWATSGTLIASGVVLTLAGALGYVRSDPQHSYACSGATSLCVDRLEHAADANVPRTRLPLGLIVPGTLLISAGLGVLGGVVRLARERRLPRIGGRR